ncbi:MAG: hypothetical protein WD646_08460 [Actinomycetota bacterium]
MKPKIVAIAAALLLVASACDRLPFVGGGGEERTVLVDYSHDEFASFFLANFPRKIQVTPGTTVVFRQTWTGEPHTVTGGTSIDKAVGSPLLKFVTAFENLAAAGVELPNPEGPPTDATLGDVIEIVEESEESEDRTNFLEAYDEMADDGEVPDRDEAKDVTFGEFVEDVDPKIEEAFSSVPFAFNEETNDIAQNVGQPCYLTRGAPPKDPDKPCAQQEQPEFNGTQSFYSSGIIPYEGPQGNTYNVRLSDNIDPGKYFFYCAIHGPGQSTEVTVRPAGTDIPTQEEVSRQARKEIDLGAKPLEKVYRAAVDDGRIQFGGPDGPSTLRGPFAGLFSQDYDHAVINEFVPRQLEVARNEPISWKMMGAEHTITFGVPRYFPIVQFLDNGKIRFNPRLRAAAGGAEKAPEYQDGPEPLEHDAGTYDGSGFWSTGSMGADTYVDVTMRISEPGTYDFACLIHPPMVGKITVT